MAGVERNHSWSFERPEVLCNVRFPLFKNVHEAQCAYAFFCYTQPTPLLSSLMRVGRTSVCVVLGDVGSF